MNKQQLELMREWVRAEIKHSMLNHLNGRGELNAFREAEALFNELTDAFGTSLGPWVYEWATWRAVDKNGAIHEFATQPYFKNDHEWTSRTMGVQVGSVACIKNWKESAEKRL